MAVLRNCKRGQFHCVDEQRVRRRGKRIQPRVAWRAASPERFPGCRFPRASQTQWRLQLPPHESARPVFRVALATSSLESRAFARSRSNFSPLPFFHALHSRQNDRACNDRTRPRAASRFVNSGDDETARPKGVFELESRNWLGHRQKHKSRGIYPSALIYCVLIYASVGASASAALPLRVFLSSVRLCRARPRR